MPNPCTSVPPEHALHEAGETLPLGMPLDRRRVVVKNDVPETTVSEEVQAVMALSNDAVLAHKKHR
jgi:hypothetical protein